MDLKATRYEVIDGIAVVTLARPKRRNAWTGRMHTEYRWILREADNDPAVRAIVQDIPLLLEKRLDSGCDVLVYVDAPKTVRLERVERERGWSAADLERREKKQMPLDTKRDRAHYVVDNSVGKSVCLDQVRRILSQILHERP